MACPHCLAPGDAVVSPENAVRILQQIAALGPHELLLTGGEPLAYSELPALLKEIAAWRIRWSLNTAAFPSRAVRHAIEAWPPVFVAVSLDGPREVHDVFRGRAGACDAAMAAIDYFGRLLPHGVAAGTTVTRANFPHLAETFAMVANSGAHAWGIHLVVREGRARTNPRLLLTHRELRGLLRFVAEKRKHFPVTMADEIGYCGPWDPLVRESPFVCGAGTRQCVILPDGEVVPCTTIDRSASAGNVLEQDIAHIWKHGFADLRSWRPSGRCSRCAYQSACRGGCWLVRRHGVPCARDVWDHPSALSTAAGAAVCLGLAACGRSVPSSVPAERAAPSAVLPTARTHAMATADTTASAPGPADWRVGQGTSQLAAAADLRVGQGRESVCAHSSLDEDLAAPGLAKLAKGDSALDRALVRLTFASPGSLCTELSDSVLALARIELGTDPASAYLASLADKTCPAKLETRVNRIRDALRTSRRSLVLLAVLWRDLQEWALHSDPVRRTAEERAQVRAVLREIAKAAQAWTPEAPSSNVEAFILRDCEKYMGNKAGPPPECRDVGKGSNGILAGSLAKEWLRGSPDPFTRLAKVSVRLQSGTLKIVGPLGERDAIANDRMGPFDIAMVPNDSTAPAILAFPALDNWTIALAPGVEGTLLDLGRIVVDLHAKKLETFVAPVRGGARNALLMIPLLQTRLLDTDKNRALRACRQLGAAWLF